MRTLKMTLVLVFCFGFVRLSYGQPDTLWTKIWDFDVSSADSCGMDNIIITKSNSDTLYEYNSDGELVNEFVIKMHYEANKRVRKIPSDGFLLQHWDCPRKNKSTNNNLVPQNPNSTCPVEYLKLDENGDSLWNIEPRLESWKPHAILENSDIIVWTGSLMKKYDAVGNMVLEKEFNKRVELINSLSDKKFVVIQEKLDDNHHSFLSIFSNDGDSLNQFSVNTPECESSMAAKVFIVPANVNEFMFIHNTPDTLSIYKCHVSGDIIWQRKYQLNVSIYRYSSTTVSSTSDGGFVLIGQSTLQEYQGFTRFAKFSKDGELLWEQLLGLKHAYEGLYIKETSDHGYIALSRDNLFGKSTIIMRFKPDTITVPVSSVDHQKITPEKYLLSQNYPNPFNPFTTIEFNLPKAEYVMLDVYNVVGKKVTTIVSKNLQGGNHTWEFDGSNLPSGVYFYRLQAAEYVAVKKMLLIK